MKSWYQIQQSWKLLIICNFICYTLIMYMMIMMMVAKAESSSIKKARPFYVFGDSTVDAGNNNYIATVAKCNFPPYGRDFPNHIPTGRFTNGKLTIDYIAIYGGAKKDALPPYLDPKLSIEELMSGVSFASGGSGFDPLTPSISNVLTLEKQVDNFRECKRRLEGVFGKEETKNHIERAAFLISAGTNDFVLNYLSLPVRRKSYTLLEYQRFVIQQLKHFLQELLNEGGRKIAVTGLPPIGCLPVVITLYSDERFGKRGCIDKYSSIARDYNQMLQNELNLMQLQLNSSNPSSKVYYIDIYQPLSDMVQDPQKYGFDVVDSGCCGSGYIETSFLCNHISSVCSDPSKYLFWDSVHPTQKGYQNLFSAFRPTFDLINNDD